MIRRSRAFAAVVGLGLGIGLSSGVAHAQSSEKDADAERLFREGQKLMEERRFGEACPKFEAAYRKDQQLGTLLNLAYCHKEQGAVWQSWLEFREAELKAVELKRSDRKDFARARMAELEKSLARVVVDTPQKADLTEVLVEDRRVPEAEKGSTFAAEPGQRKLTFRAKGKKQVVQLVTIVKSEKPQHVSVPEMEDQAKEPPIVEAPVSRPSEDPKPVTTPPASAERSSDGSTQRTVGLVVAGVGVAGLALGSVFGLMTLSGNACNDGKPGCPQSVRDDASQKAGIATVSLIAGGALFLGGGVLWLAAPSGKSSATVGGATKGARTVRVTPEIGAGWAGVRGVF